jgi:hypothetical protein
MEAQATHGEMMMADPVKQLTRILAENGFKLVRQGKHFVYCSETLGNRIFVTAASPSDSYRGAKNAISSLKAVIAAPPRAEVLAVEEFEKARAAEISLQKMEKSNLPGPGSGGRGGTHKSSFSGFYYDEIKKVELTPEQVEERGRLKIKREANDAEWKIQRQERRNERQAKELARTEIEVKVQRGIDLWAGRTVRVDQELADDFFAALRGALDNCDEIYSIVTALYPDLVAKYKNISALPTKEHFYDLLFDRVSDAELTKIGPFGFDCVVTGMAEHMSAEDIKNEVRSAIAEKRELRIGRVGWPIPSARPSIARHIQRHLKAWFNSIESGKPFDPYRVSEAEMVAGISHVLVTVNRAQYPPPTALIAEMLKERPRFTNTCIIMRRDADFFKFDKNNEPAQGEGYFTARMTDANNPSWIEAGMEKGYEPLALVGAALEDGIEIFYLKLYPRPKEFLDLQLAASIEAVKVCLGSKGRVLDYRPGWPQVVKQNEPETAIAA